MTPTQQDNELREKLKEAVLETGRYETIGDEQLEDKYLRRFIDELVLHAKAYTDKRVLEARIDERNKIALDTYRGKTVSEATNWQAKFEYFMYGNEKRIAKLKAQRKEI